MPFGWEQTPALVVKYLDMQKWHPIVVLLLGSIFIGCLGDDVFEEVKYRPILQPPLVTFKAQAPGNLIAQWAPSPTDTQTNFQGYYVELHESIQDSTFEIDELANLVSTAHVPKSDTFYVFQNIPKGRYTLSVWGERVPNPDNPDSIVLSQFAARYSFSFDTDPVEAPKVFLAQSRGQANVVVYWQASASVTQPGMVGYILRYRDNTKSNSEIYTLRIPGKGPAPQTLSLNLLSTSSQGYETPYKIWIKSIRNDSTESADSMIIVWSGAHLLGPNQPIVLIGKKIFIGQTNSMYEIKELDDPSAQIGVTAVDSTITLEAFQGAKFSQQIDVTTLDSMFFSRPIPDSAYTETTLTLPRNPASSVCIYVLFARNTLDNSQARARIMFLRDPGGTLIFGNAVRVEARFQPGSPPYFLPYF